jgi:hypothetical protein
VNKGGQEKQSADNFVKRVGTILKDDDIFKKAYHMSSASALAIVWW